MSFDPNTALAVGVPTLAVLIGILVNNSRLSDQRAHIDVRFVDLDKRFDDLKDTLNARFDAARADLLRVEGIMDARLKHLEEE